MVLLYGLVGLAWVMVWLCGHRTVKCGLAGIAWYMVLPGGHCMVDGTSWRASYSYGLAGKAWGLA